MIFRCRWDVPRHEGQSWVSVEATSAGDAAQTFHLDRDREGLCIMQAYKENGSEQLQEISFARIEVECDGKIENLVSRVYSRRVYRKGGVKPRETFEQKLAVIAKKLRWSGAASELLEPWENEGDWQ